MPDYLCIVGWPFARACEGRLQETEEVPSGARSWVCQRCGAQYPPAALKRLPYWAQHGLDEAYWDRQGGKSTPTPALPIGSPAEPDRTEDGQPTRAEPHEVVR